MVSSVGGDVKFVSQSLEQSRRRAERACRRGLPQGALQSVLPPEPSVGVEGPGSWQLAWTHMEGGVWQDQSSPGFQQISQEQENETAL